MPPEGLVVYCDAPPEIRTARLEAQDGTVLSDAAAAHHTEREVDRLRELADWVWDNAGPQAETWHRV